MKLLIPLDGSAAGQRALDYVIAHADAFGGAPEIFLLNVQLKVATANVKLFIDQNTIDDYYREQGEAALQMARAALDASKFTYQYHISIGSPAESIAQYAAKLGVDQIVMTRQGEGGLQLFLLGSVVNRVLHLADCPVLLIK